MEFSIIIPFFRGNDVIEKAVESCKRSITKANITAEIIIVNDSPDVNVNLNDSDIIILRNDANRGIHYSRVRGINYSNGNYIHMLDQDDYIEEDFYSKCLTKIRSADVVVVNGVMQYSDGCKKLYKNWMYASLCRIPIAYVIFGNRITSPGQCVIKKTSVPELWKENIQHIIGADDYLLWLMMFGLHKKFVYVNECLYEHVFTDRNVSLNEDTMMNSVEEIRILLVKTQPSNFLNKPFKNYLEYYRTGKVSSFIALLLFFVEKYRHFFIRRKK